MWSLLIGILLVCPFLSTAQNANFRESVILKLNKEVYAPGEEIFFSAFVFEGQSIAPTGGSGLLHVRVSNPQNELIFSGVLELKQGRGEGSFTLPDTLSQPAYNLIAFTNYMRNFPKTESFQKVIPVVSRSALRSLRFDKDSVKTSLIVKAFPQGGYLQANRLNTIYFSAEDHLSKPVQLTGYLVTDSDTLCSFVTDEFGIASSTFKPNKNHMRFAISAKGNGFEFHEHITLSFSEQILSVKQDKERFRVYIYDIANQKRNLKLRLMHNDIVLFQKEVKTSSSGILVPFAKSTFPDGVSSFELLHDSTVISSQKVFKSPRMNERISIEIDSSTFALSSIANINVSIPLDTASLMVSIREYNEGLAPFHEDFFSQMLPKNTNLGKAALEKWGHVWTNFQTIEPREKSQRKGYVLEKNNLAFQNIDLGSEGIVFTTVQGSEPFFEFTEIRQVEGSGFVLPVDFAGGDLWLSSVEGGLTSDFYEFTAKLDASATKLLLKNNLAKLENYYQRLSENEFFAQKFGVERSVQMTQVTSNTFPSPVPAETVHRFDDYITLEDFREALFEFVSELKFKKDREGLLVPYVEKLSDEGIGIGLNEYPAYVFVNGVFTTNYQGLLDLKFRQIDSVEIYHKGLIFGAEEVGGIASIYTKDPEKINAQLSSAKPVKIPEMIRKPGVVYSTLDKKDHNIPYFVEQIYWNSNLTIQNEKEVISFGLPDSRKPLLIEIYGFTNTGEIINVTEVIDNFWTEGLDTN